MQDSEDQGKTGNKTGYNRQPAIILITFLLIFQFLTFFCHAGTWEDTCYLLSANPKSIERPEVIIVEFGNPILQGHGAICYVRENLVFSSTAYEPWIAHEFSHAIMWMMGFPLECQEKWAIAIQNNFTEYRDWRP